MSVRQLKLREVVFRRYGSAALWLIHFVFGVGISIFFRRIETFNGAKIPSDGGVIFVSNHPNALIDPALLFVALPRPVAFLAKSTLFKMPVIGWLIKTVGALPLYRQQDAGQDVSKNQETFLVARELLKQGGAIAIFPEGISHDHPKLQPLKTGAARIALGAVSAGKSPASLTLRIVPVGLYYTDKTSFRSEALLHVGDPIDVFPVAIDESGHPSRESVRELTARMESALRTVTLNAENDEDLDVAKVAEEVFTSVTPHEDNLAERLEFLQKFVSDGSADAGESVEKLLAEYDRKLSKLKIESEFLSLADYSKRFILRKAFERSWFLLVLAPFAVVGAIIHAPVYFFGKILAWTQTRKGFHDMSSTMKLLNGLALFPATWIVFGGIVLLAGFGWIIAGLAVPFAFVCGWIALRSIEEIEELSGWMRAITAFFLRREKFLRLLAERRRIFAKVAKD